MVIDLKDVLIEIILNLRYNRRRSRIEDYINKRTVIDIEKKYRIS